MNQLVIRIDTPETIPPLLQAITKIVPREAVTLWTAQAPPAEADADDAIDPELLKQVVQAVRSTKDWRARKAFLLDILSGDDSLSMTRGGDESSALRATSSSLSRSLKRVFPHLASPLGVLADRQRVYSAEGLYKAVRYRPTKLLLRVRDELKATGKW